MIIDNAANKQLRQALPPVEFRVLERALEAIGCAPTDVTFMPLNNRHDAHASETQAVIRLDQFGDKQLTLNMKARTSKTVFHCRLDFTVRPQGRSMQETVKLLNEALKEAGYGNTSEEKQSQTHPPPPVDEVAPALANLNEPDEEPPKPATPPVSRTADESEPEGDDDEAAVSDKETPTMKGFINRDYEVRAFMVGLSKEHGAGPYDYQTVRTALKECFGTMKGSAFVIEGLLNKGYFVAVGEKLQPLAEGETPVPNGKYRPGGRRSKTETPTLPDDDPLVVRQRQMMAVFEREVAKKAGLAGKQAELDVLLRQQEELGKLIAKKREELEQDKATIVSDDTLADIDRLLMRLGNTHPHLVHELKAS